MIKILGLAVILLWGNMFFAQEIFVSPLGSKKGKGTLKSPYKSMDKALERVLQIKSKDSKKKVVINLRGGVYNLHNTIKLGSGHSNISINAYNKETVVLSGGTVIPLERIMVSDVKTNNNNKSRTIYEVDLGKIGISDFGELRNVGFSRPYGPAWGELFINDKAMHLARWPNEGMVQMGKVLDKGSVPRHDDFSDRGGIIEYDSLRINNWAKEKDAWMAGYFMWGYADDMVKIAKIDTIQHTLTTASATLYGYGDNAEWRNWYGVNILGELDTDGEYYIDREKGMLYFISNQKNISSLEFSILEEPFFQIEGAKEIAIKGISFEKSRGIGIAMANTAGVTIENCTFKNLGSLGIVIGKGVKPFSEYRHAGTGIPMPGVMGSLQQHLYSNTTFNREGGTNNKIVGCNFNELGAGGVSIGGGNRLSLDWGNNLVENCVFSNLNRIEKSYRPAIDITGVGNKIRHCEIYDAPSMAILIHGNNHLIEYNYIHDVCLEVEDQGAIYYGRDPSERGNVIRYNYFENIPDRFATCAVYHDDGACGLTVTGNIFYKAGKWNALLGGGSDNTYTNNIFIENMYGLHIDNRMDNWAKSLLAEKGVFEERMDNINYSKPPYSIAYPEIVNYWENPALPQRNIVEDNVFVKVKQKVDGKLEWLEYKKSNWETNEDPGFKDYRNKNFSLKKDALLYKKVPGFKEIPFQKIGNYKKSDNNSE